MKNRILIAAALCAAATPAQAQLAREFSVTVAPNYRSFGLPEELAASSASERTVAPVRRSCTGSDSSVPPIVSLAAAADGASGAATRSRFG